MWLVVTWCSSMRRSISSGVHLSISTTVWPDVQRVARPHQHGRVVERRAGDVHVAVVRAARRTCPGSRRSSSPRSSGSMSTSAALHALGLAGGARRVVHGGAGDAVRRARCRAGRRSARRRAGTRRRRRRRSGRSAGTSSLGQRLAPASSAKRSSADEHLGVAVVDDVGDLGADEVVVDRREVQADLQGAEVELDACSRSLGSTTATVSPVSRPRARSPWLIWLACGRAARRRVSPRPSWVTSAMRSGSSVAKFQNPNAMCRSCSPCGPRSGPLKSDGPSDATARLGGGQTIVGASDPGAAALPGHRPMDRGGRR